MPEVKEIIEAAWDQRAEITPDTASRELKSAVEEVINQLDAGQIRVAEKKDGTWVTNEWVKKAVLLYFRSMPNYDLPVPGTAFYDKVPLKFNGYTPDQFKEAEIRVVPHAIVRKGAYISKHAVLMPSYVNIGAYVGEGTMVDTWVTVGSCAQIGSHCHLSGGVGIGGVLEPVQANPTIIEDNCFIGGRCEIAEGVVVEEGSVIGMGVFLSKSTKIFDRTTGEIFHGRVPAGSVVVSGSLPSKTGNCSLYAAVIVKHVDAKTRGKTGVNELLRDI